MNIKIPELCLVMLVGPSGSGKSSFAAKHFLATEVLSSDWCRGLVADDENDQGATKEAFAVLHYIARTRLLGGRLTVVDATNVQMEARKPLVQLAKDCHVLSRRTPHATATRVASPAAPSDRSAGGSRMR